MLVWVPEPVWNTTNGNSSSQRPSMTSCGAHNQIDLALRKLAQFSVSQSGTFLQNAKSSNDRSAPTKALDTDREVHVRPLGLCTPQVLRRYPHLSQSIFFNADRIRDCETHCFLSSFENFISIGVRRLIAGS